MKCSTRIRGQIKNVQMSENKATQQNEKAIEWKGHPKRIQRIEEINNSSACNWLCACEFVRRKTMKISQIEEQKEIERENGQREREKGEAFSAPKCLRRSQTHRRPSIPFGCILERMIRCICSFSTIHVCMRPDRAHVHDLWVSLFPTFPSHFSSFGFVSHARSYSGRISFGQSQIRIKLNNIRHEKKKKNWWIWRGDSFTSKPTHSIPYTQYVQEQSIVVVAFLFHSNIRACLCVCVCTSLYEALYSFYL